MTQPELTIWTTWCEYAATGEGHALMARVGGARGEQQCREQFAAAFDPFYTLGCQAQPGLVRNHVTELLWSPKLLDFLPNCKNPAAVVAEAQRYLNFS